jgi:MFS family permease
MALVEASSTLTMVQVSVYLSELGASIGQIGLFFTVSAIIPLIFRILGGYLSDSVGRLRALTIGSIAGILGYFAFTIAPTWQFAIIGPTMLGIARALVYPSYKAYIADNTAEEVRARYFGLSETVITIAWIIGGPIGGFLAQNFGYRFMFGAAVFTYSSATLLFAGLHIAARRRQPTSPSRVSFETLGTSLRDVIALTFAGGLVTWVLVTDGIVDIASKLSHDLMPVYLGSEIGLSKQGIGLLDGIHGIALAATMFPAGYLIDKTSERLGVLLGMIFLILSMVVFGVATGFWGFALSWVLLGFTVSMFDPAISSLLSKGVPQRLRGVAYGLVVTNVGIISLPFPWIGGQIWTRFGPKVPFFLTAALAFLIIIPAWFKLIYTNKNASKEPPSATADPTD